jgi:hypothetical protein
VPTSRQIYPYLIPIGASMSYHRSVTGIADVEVRVRRGRVPALREVPIQEGRTLKAPTQ